MFLKRQARQAQQQQDLQNLASTGGLERGIAQAQLEAQRQTKVQDITDPFQRLSFVSDIQEAHHLLNKMFNRASLQQLRLLPKQWVLESELMRRWHLNRRPHGSTINHHLH